MTQESWHLVLALLLIYSVSLGKSLSMLPAVESLVVFYVFLTAPVDGEMALGAHPGLPEKLHRVTEARLEAHKPEDK